MKTLKFLLLLSLSGCSYFIEKRDTALVDEKDYYNNIPKAQTYCPLEQKTNLQLVGANPAAQQEFLNLIQSLEQADFFDQFALWSLMQMAIRPDHSSLTSRMQLLLHYQNDSHYFDFFSESSDHQYPYLFGIEWILKKFGKKASLESYARTLDERVSRKLKVGKELEKFLRLHQDAIKPNEKLQPFFFRGTEILKENERVPYLSFTELVKYYRKYQKNQKIIINTGLTPFVSHTGDKGSCNYDFNLYDNSIFLIDKFIPIANLYGLATAKGAFLTSSSQRIENIAPIADFPLFHGESKVRSSAVCIMEKEDNKIWTISNQSRDPGQHLFHLIRYGLPRTNSTAEVDKLIRHSRHLFLSDPVRLIIESQRSRPDQIENLLKLNLPIYNAERIGNIWSYTSFGKKNRFIVDDRNPGTFSCK
jgi:hypothetical protein